MTVSGDPDREATFAAELAAEPRIELALRCVDRTELIAAMRAGGVEAVVFVGLPGWLDPQTTYEIVNAGASLIGLLDDEADAVRLQRLGGVQLPATASPHDVLVASAEDLSSAKTAVIPRDGELGRLVAVWGPKGAPGRTSVAIEMAATVALADPSTLLVDADPYGGDVLQMLGVMEELPSVVWATRMAEKGELDPGSLLIELRRAGRRGPVFLPGLPRPELWAEISEYGWRRLLEIARSAFHFVICDVGFCLEPESPSYTASSLGRNGIARLSVGEADHVVAVCRADPVGVRSFLWAFDHLEELVDPASVIVLLNRARSSSAREARDVIDRHIGKRVRAILPDRPADFARAVMAGRPVMGSNAPRDLTDPLRDLAMAVGAEVPPRGILTKLARGKG